MIGWKSATQNDLVAGFRYRVRKPVDLLAKRGHDVEVFTADRSESYSGIVFSKSYSADDLALAEAVKRRGGFVIFDLFDNHFYNPGLLKRFEVARKRLLHMISLSDRVITSTPVLQEVIRNESGAVATVVGDIAERYKAPAEDPAEFRNQLRLLWFGSHGSPNAPGGMEDLLLIREPLSRLRLSHEASLVVLSNSLEKFDAISLQLPLRSEYREWSQDSYHTELGRADAVVLPVGLNPFTACKTHNRLTSALYAGKPVVATRLDSYAEFADFCFLDDWDHGLSALVDDLEGQRERASSSRAYIDERWSGEAIAPLWERALGLPETSATARRRRTPAMTSTAKAFQGRLDALAAGAITGWVRDLKNPETPLEVSLEADGEVVMVSLADLPRDDLKFARADHSRCGFALSLQEVGVADPASVKVRVVGSDWIVGENPILLTANVRAPAVARRADLVLVEETQAYDSAIADLEAIDEQERLFAEVAVVESLLVNLKSNLTRALVAFENAPAAARAMRRTLEATGVEPSPPEPPRQVKG